MRGETLPPFEQKNKTDGITDIFACLVVKRSFLSGGFYIFFFCAEEIVVCCKCGSNEVKCKKNDGAKKYYLENQIENGDYEFRLKPIFIVVQFSLVAPSIPIIPKGKDGS